jgi:hypothetical protein
MKGDVAQLVPFFGVMLGKWRQAECMSVFERREFAGWRGGWSWWSGGSG